MVGWCGFAVLSTGWLAHAVERALAALHRALELVQRGPVPAARGGQHSGAARRAAPLDQAAQLVGLGWALWLEWFVFRLTLGIGFAAAAGLVVLDVAIGVLLAAVGVTLAGG